MGRSPQLLVLVLVLAAPAALLARGVPQVEDQQLEEDPYMSVDPSDDNFTGLLLHVADRVAGQSETNANTENRIKGIDRFIQRLVKGMSPDERGRSRSDIWNYKSYENSTQAREKVKLAYDKLREGAKTLTEQKDKLKEALEVLERVGQNHQRFVDFMRPTSESMQTAFSQTQPGSETDAPRYDGGPVEAGLLENIVPQQPFLDPIAQRVEQIASQVQQVKSKIDQAKGLAQGLDMYAEKAKEISQESRKLAEEKRMAGRQTSRSGSNEQSDGERVIRDAKAWLLKTVAKAEKAQEEFDKLTRPREGFLDSSEKETKAEEKITKGKDDLKQGAQDVDGRTARVKNELASRWQQAAGQPDEADQRRQIAGEALQEKTQVGQKRDAAQQTLRDTEQVEQESRRTVQKLKEDFEKAVRLLGKKRGDEIPDLPDLNLHVEQPVVGTRASQGRTQKGSKKPKYPEVLDADPNDIVGEMDGRSYAGNDATPRSRRR